MSLGWWWRGAAWAFPAPPEETAGWWPRAAVSREGILRSLLGQGPTQGGHIQTWLQVSAPPTVCKHCKSCLLCGPRPWPWGSCCLLSLQDWGSGHCLEAGAPAAWGSDHSLEADAAPHKSVSGWNLEVVGSSLPCLASFPTQNENALPDKEIMHLVDSLSWRELWTANVV